MVLHHHTSNTKFSAFESTIVPRGTASTGNDGVLCLDCDSRRAFGPTKTIRGVFWTQLNRLERLAALSAFRGYGF